MRPTPRWNEELPLRPRPPSPPPRHYSITVDRGRPVSVAINHVRPAAAPVLRGPTPKHVTISGAAINRAVRVAKLRARILALPPHTRAAYLRQLRSKARAKGVR